MSLVVTEGQSLTLTGNLVGANVLSTNETRLSNIESTLLSGENNIIESENSVAFGDQNQILNVTERDSNSDYSFVEGYNNIVQEWYGHAEGTGTIADGKIAHAEGNQSVCSANDSHAEGNLTVAGRKRYTKSSSGTEDAGDGLGTKPYIVVADSEGDVSSYFPNELTDNITTRYGAGAQKDDKGNIYPNGMTPATYSGDIITAANDLKWAMHSYCIIKGSGEGDKGFFRILKAVYSGGSGTKIYYENSGEAYSGNIAAIYSSYAPTVVVEGIQGGNGSHVEGRQTSTYGYGSHAEGQLTKAWNSYAHAEGNQNLASGIASHVEGYVNKATGDYSHAEGNGTLSSGESSHAEGLLTTASGDYSHAEGESCVASGTRSHTQGRENTSSGSYSHSQGRGNTASGSYSHAMGFESVANHASQISNAVGKFNTAGDAQHSRIINKIAGAGAGWWDLPLVTMNIGETYTGTTKLVGRQYGGANGVVGESVAYRFEWTVKCTGSGTASVLYNVRTLAGADFVDDSDTVGDHLTTGIRAALHTTYFADNKLRLRIDGIATRSIYWLCDSEFLELKAV